MRVCRCAFHAFGLLLGSVLSHGWASALVSKTQAIVTYFQASHQPCAALRAAALDLGIRIGLMSSNKTRMTSVHMCASSVHSNEHAFARMLRTAAQRPGGAEGLVKKPEVLATLQDRAYWQDLDALCQLLQPISQAIMAIQARNATLADVTR